MPPVASGLRRPNQPSSTTNSSAPIAAALGQAICPSQVTSKLVASHELHRTADPRRTSDYGRTRADGGSRPPGPARVERHDWRVVNVSPSNRGELGSKSLTPSCSSVCPYWVCSTTVFVLPLKARAAAHTRPDVSVASRLQDRVGTVVVVGDPVAGLEHDLATDLLDGLLELGPQRPSTLRNVRSWNGMANCAEATGLGVRGPARHW